MVSVSTLELLMKHFYTLTLRVRSAAFHGVEMPAMDHAANCVRQQIHLFYLSHILQTFDQFDTRKEDRSQAKRIVKLEKCRRCRQRPCLQTLDSSGSH
jgi:hypothetical protein